MKPLPIGTITFLFTDIEGSTKTWEAHAEIMRVSLSRHDALLRKAIEKFGGTIFKTVGDGFYAAFASPPEAISAVIEAQSLLQKEPWPNETIIRVRMALHTGVAEFRDGDYYGTVLNRVARLLVTGHGGQALLSAATYELVRDHLTKEIALRDLGSHRLKDLERPEQVFQILHPDLEEVFPPLRTLDSTPNNLPQQLTSFIGREKSIVETRALITSNRLLTLTGSGGSGKTRLALQVAADTLEDYPDGAWLVELAPISDPALVIPTVSSALRIKEQGGQSMQQTLFASLQEKKLLLVLDNCEHVVSACAQFIAALLRACPQVRALITSREPMRITGEQTYRVPSLSLPTAKQASIATVETVSQYEAVRLFIERALLVKPDFEITNRIAPALAQLCYRLDGIPLAIELAAARVSVLSVENINNKLDSCFRLLTGGDRSALPRQQTLKALVDWSYDLLQGQEKTLFNYLSVFSGGWTLSAAEAVCGFDPIETWEVLDLLTSLVNKSLVVVEESVGSVEIRYRMLETLRQYASEKRDQQDPAREVQKRYVHFFVEFASEAESRLNGPEQVAWLNILELEHDNLRATLNWYTADTGVEELSTNVEAALRLSASLVRFWHVRGYWSEGRKNMEAALERARNLSLYRTSLVAQTLIAASNLAHYQGDIEVARSLIEESLAIRQDLGDKRGIAGALLGLGTLISGQGDFAAARVLLEESLAICREIGNKHGMATTLNNLGNLARSQGDLVAARSFQKEGLGLFRDLDDKRGVGALLGNLGTLAKLQGDFITARSLYGECLNLFKELGDKHGTAYALSSLSGLAYHQGDFAQTKQFIEESVALSRELGDKQGVAESLNILGSIFFKQEDFENARSFFEDSLTVKRELADERSIAESLNNLASVAHAQGDSVTARSMMEESLALKRKVGDKTGIAYALEGLAAIYSGKFDSRTAVVLWGAAASLRETLGAPLPPSEQSDQNAQLSQMRSVLKSDEFSRAWNEGYSLSMEQALEYAFEFLASEQRPG